MVPASRASSNDGKASAIVAGCVAVAWVWLVAGTHLHEMIVGAATVVLATLFFRTVRRCAGTGIDLKAKDLAQGWRIPWYILSGMWTITIILIKDLLYLRRAGSYYRVSGFKSSKRDLQVVAREVLAVVYTTATPNFIVIGIDPEQSRMLFYQMERSSIPKMTQALGAQP